LELQDAFPILFEKKGQIIIDHQESTDVDEEELMMAALEAGAEDFNVEPEAYEIITRPEDVHSVKEALESQGYTLLEAEAVYLPQTLVHLEEEDQKKMDKLIDMLEDNDDVQEVHHNWEQE
jgi:transcriptional/translational regulatory protein YebC/TACO1